jgi:hypothetical protein
MATVPFRDFGNARGEMDRLFAEMPGAPAALVLMVATRGRLGCVGPRDDLSRAADAMNEPAGLEALPPPELKTRTERDAPAQIRGAPHQSVGIGSSRHPSTRSNP